MPLSGPRSGRPSMTDRVASLRVTRGRILPRCPLQLARAVRPFEAGPWVVVGIQRLLRRAAVRAPSGFVLRFWTPGPRRLDPRRLAGLLGVVRRPRGVALALYLVARAELQQRLERPAGLVDPLGRIAPCGHEARDCG